MSLYWVNNQTYKICIEAVKQDRFALEYVRDKNLNELGIKILKEQGKARGIIAIKENGEWLFTVGCQKNISKEKFIHRIYTENGGFDPEKGINVHRQVYLDFLKEFLNIERAI
ncbi:hypothetical protein QMM46_08095 [Clostridioides difficile]|uniref:hypothetical protein n=1 Tax=Clostridioides difficile TaxID=1496 RepID=UPI001F2A98C9|nr:hypothetical protein [Clostridioides difficile]MCW0773939.1 hypothetical protein [Clostridioides difficile]MDI2978128.1 hypothetical protein [Clostridioides difficile]MDI6151071.1 hypothetical protein [Clostridioides difficile]MDI7827522.1 hypothetical protein [Clostridioides difficile]MDU8820204.1 hypothetical protein [Clostridioides difficile]